MSSSSTEQPSPHLDKPAAKPTAKPKRKESQLLNLLLNIVIPALVLSKLSGPDNLGPVWALIVGLSFPLGYGLYDFFSQGKFNFISALGIISTSLTGGFSLMQLDVEWLAIKEAAIPLVLGLFVLGSVLRGKPIIKSFLYKPELVKVDMIEARLKEQDNTQKFDDTLKNTTIILAGSFFLSSILNYGLAKYLLQSPPGTEAFNQELGQMTALSYPVIVLPSMVVMIGALWYMVNGIKRLTGFGLEEIMQIEESKAE